MKALIVYLGLIAAVVAGLNYMGRDIAEVRQGVGLIENRAMEINKILERI